MRNKKGNNLIIIENGRLTSYVLDKKNIWEIGRPSKENMPDIKLHSATVSRKHGKFQNVNGVWFYLDYNGKNGTVYNKKHITPGLKGNIKPIILNDGDIFVFGGGEEAVINCKTIWAMFTTKVYDEKWHTIDTEGYSRLQFTSGEDTITLDNPEKGTVIDRKDGTAIYMGNLTYLIGDMEVIGS